MKKAIEFLLVACLSVTFVSAILYAYFLYEEKELLQNEVELKQNIIDKYHERDSIMRKVYMGADSTGTFIYRHIGDSVVSYRALLEQSDKLRDELSGVKIENGRMQDSLWVKNSVIKMLHEEYDFSYKVETVNNKMTVTLSFKEKQIEN